MQTQSFPTQHPFPPFSPQSQDFVHRWVSWEAGPSSMSRGHLVGLRWCISLAGSQALHAILSSSVGMSAKGPWKKAMWSLRKNWKTPSLSLPLVVAVCERQMYERHGRLTAGLRMTRRQREKKGGMAGYTCSVASHHLQRPSHFWKTRYVKWAISYLIGKPTEGIVVCPNFYLN